MPKCHEENRHKVCLLCFQKAIPPKQIHQTLIATIVDRFLPDYNGKDEIYPKVLCQSCYITVYRCKKGEKFKQIEVHKYAAVKRSTRSTNHINCDLCKVAQMKCFQMNKKKPKNMEKFLKICKKCLSHVGPGKRHLCTAGKKLMNLSDLAKESKQHFVSKTVREAACSSARELRFSNVRGKPTRFHLAQPKDVVQFTHGDIMDMKMDLGLSITKTLKLAQNLRKKGQRRVVQTNFTSAIGNMVSELEDFYSVVQLNVVAGNVSSVRSVVICRSVEGLISYVKARRNVDQVSCKLGIDGGQGSLKIILNLEEGLNAEGLKDSGVRKCFILALAPGVAENYANISELWLKLGLNKLEGTVAGDLKVINILAGVMSNSSTFPCAYCTAHKETLGSCKGLSRTLGTIRNLAESWRNSGGNEKEAKHFFNCVNNPVLCGDDDTKIVDICPPPSLHLFLGLMNTVYNSVAKVQPDCAKIWATAANATRHAQFGFAGRHCRSLLAKRDVLTGDALSELVQVLNDMDYMMIHCFKDVLMDGFESAVTKFCNSWLAAKLPRTPKFHIVKYHIIDFCESSGTGLAKFTEQTTEAVHHDFAQTWANYKVAASHSKYDSNLLKAVVSYNSSHI